MKQYDFTPLPADYVGDVPVESASVMYVCGQCGDEVPLEDGVWVDHHHSRS